VAGKDKRDDSRLNVARYQVDRLARELGDAPEEPASTAPAVDDDETNTAGQAMMEQLDQAVEISIQQAMRRGDFDGLPGAGKPIAGLGGTHDPNWWIRRKIEREQLTGLGPPALTLRTEDKGLSARLDAAASERAVREILEDFNARVIEARRQLLGGPPVVTPVRDVEAEVAAWHERRSRRLREAERLRELERERDAAERVSWFRRWRLALAERRAARR
jgi:hypothetical protein